MQMAELTCSGTKVQPFQHMRMCFEIPHVAMLRSTSLEQTGTVLCQLVQLREQCSNAISYTAEVIK